MTLIAVTVDDTIVGVDPAKVHAWCVAVDKQAREFAIAWNVPYTPVVFYSSDVLLKLEGAELQAFTSDARLLTIQATLDVAGALGYHDDIAGVIFARVEWQDDATSVTLSHEVLEELGDPTCDAWAALGDGRTQALEACDRVEGDTYEIDGVTVSNYLLPTAFVKDSAGPWDKLGRLKAWDGMTSGGYMAIQAADGSETEVFAMHEDGWFNAERRRGKVGGRLARRLAK